MIKHIILFNSYLVSIYEVGTVSYSHFVDEKSEA